MLPLEFVATPEASPRCMSGGSLMKFGTESNWSSGADVDCAKADGLISTGSPRSHGFMTNLPYGGTRRSWGEVDLSRRRRSIQTGGLVRQSHRRGRVGAADRARTAGLSGVPARIEWL